MNILSFQMIQSCHMQVILLADSTLWKEYCFCIWLSDAYRVLLGMAYCAMGKDHEEARKQAIQFIHANKRTPGTLSL